MEHRLCLFFCNLLLPEANRILRDGSYTDITLRGFPANCATGCLDIEKAIAPLLPEIDNYSKVIFVAGACRGNLKKEKAIHHKIEVIRLEQCFEVIAGLPAIYHFINQGCYLVTNGWLMNYKRHIKDWGFDATSARAFFGESIKKVLLLDTGLPHDYLPALNAVAAYMGVPYDVLPVGDSHLRMFIDALVYKWRADSERTTLNDQIAAITRQNADYSMLFHQLRNLIDSTDENRIVNEIANLINILFMPGEICFRKQTPNENFEPVWYKNATGHALIHPGNSFKIEVKHQNELLGVYDVNGVQFPEYLAQYLAMKEVITQIGGLAIANARKYAVIEKARMEADELAGRLSELNDTKDRFFNIIAHDLKSPFNAITGFSDLLISQLKEKDYDGIEQYAGIILQSSNKAMDLLSNLLEWARTQTGKIQFNPEVIPLNEFVEDIAGFFDDIAAPKNITIKRKIPQNITVTADFSMLGTIMRNLISNAIKFTPTSGEIVVSVDNKNNGVQVAVSDNGVGITGERLDQLFRIDKNVSTMGTANEKGTGLGLILCKEFVEKHGGKIWVESQVGKGSAFIFTLPPKQPG